ncbi:hypothetical protein [Nocardioides mesophilus]|uniref:Uncharacterized protein n=1 Tax=Nocardioides mesophilus TaxID=433659 RepID=A0A7G9RB41_9ACTN|nr:hypothetical protein [Nocardioides mesophilus]QNN52816.1 hypothetical protein H9L09_20720 [Nocardioides mesophilus]
MTRSRPGRALVYELAIAGRLGPVLTHALGPGVTATLREQTILRVRPAASGPGVPELVALLENEGLEIDEISSVPAR